VRAKGELVVFDGVNDAGIKWESRLGEDELGGEENKEEEQQWYYDQMTGKISVVVHLLVVESIGKWRKKREIRCLSSWKRWFAGGGIWAIFCVVG